MVRSWRSQDDLPELAVQALAQTFDGYLWVGTKGGLLRFDGARFRLFSHQNTPAFTDDSIFCLLAAHDGSLWVGTEDGGLIEWRDGVFRSYPTEQGQNQVRALAEDHDGLVWVGTDNGLFWARNGRLERAHKSLELTGFDVHAVLVDQTNRIWAGGSHLYSLKDGKSREYLLPGDDSRTGVKSLLQTPDGVIWVGTVVGLYRLRPGHDHLEPVPGVQGTIRALRQLPSGELWAGATGGGIFRVRGNRVTHLKAPSPLVSNTVYSIFSDTDNNIWIGTLGGLMRLSRTPVRILAVPQTARSDLGTVALDSDDSLWAASNQLVHFRGERADLIRFPALGNVRVRVLLRSRDGSLWVGTVGGGLYHFSAHRIEHFNTQDGLSSDFVQVLLEARDGTLWIGCAPGLNHLDRSGLHKFTAPNRRADETRALVESADGTIWAGSDRGLRRYRNGEFIHDALTGLFRDEGVWALHKDADGGMWIGTRAHGLYRYNNGSLSHYTTANGLVSDSIYCILEDQRNHLWISSPPGVMLLNRNELDAQAKNSEQPLSLRYYRASEGDSSVQLFGGMQPVGVISRTGEAWFATSLGLLGIRPDEAERPLFSHLRIEAVTADGLPQSLIGSLKLNADSRRIEFAYEPVLLRSQEELRFRYKLEGFDQTWTYAGAHQRLATYTNLPAGNHRFVVEAWETDHPERVVRASIDSFKKHYFYQDPWFLLLCVLAAILLCVLIYRLRMRQIHGRFKAVLAERTRLAREMHDTLIQGCIATSALLKAASSQDVDDNESRAHLIDYAATQIHATVDEARQAVWNLRCEELALTDLQASLQSMAESIGHKHGVKMLHRLLGKPFSISRQATHELMMVARESVFNAILHGHAQKIEVELTYLDESLSLTVRDGGQGFDAKAGLSEDHFGLRGMRERIHRFDGKFEIESKPHQGTRVSVKIPRAAIASDKELVQESGAGG
jgi:ligand-binding sensor domain-containing protein/signal transduction histidine kinase